MFSGVNVTPMNDSANAVGTPDPFSTIAVPWRRVRRLAFAIATVLGLSSVAFVYFGMIASGRPLTLRTAILAGLPNWYFWACLTPLVFWLGLRYRFERRSWPRALLVHLGAGILVVLAELAIFTIFNHWFYYNPWAPAPAQFRDAYRNNVLRGFHDAFHIYWLIVVVAHAFAFRHHDQRRALCEAGLREKNAELESLLAKSRLDALRAQLHPHFLFNAFNTISSLIRAERSQAATDMVAKLGHLMRLVLRLLDRSEIALHEELELVDAYLRVERARFEGKLHVQVDVSPSSMESLVPSMLLQPLVENAIRHGLRETGDGVLSINGRTVDGRLILEVLDTGERAAPGTQGSGFHMGLANIKARLKHMYGDDFEFVLESPPGKGTRAAIRIPHRPCAAVTEA
jgi:two-component system, LytTR family, sensor kinase